MAALIARKEELLANSKNKAKIEKIIELKRKKKEAKEAAEKPKGADASDLAISMAKVRQIQQMDGQRVLKGSAVNQDNRKVIRGTDELKKQRLLQQ